MSEIKWTLFSEKDAPHTQIYVTDFDTVWVKDLRFPYFTEGKAWAEIPIPEVPVKKRQLHECRSCTVSDLVTCFEDENGLHLKVFTEMGRRSILHIKICPFCGFKPEIDECKYHVVNGEAGMVVCNDCGNWKKEE
jgi:hypothetical protein